ncbi:WRKY transcription factor 72-like [Tripterygium wilfordii]|uniref:WRKY transcription factor 72-like n=1 Tax=Tripterygium wilfordii TaxID=458696 RepID=A0A7J7DRU5_TRIWF|nr:probable WRKY transcription factor 72 [Tripterygium wilfordii]KAF5749013.1 WRKY transcription factor 72-like [Tripterygium wilfordii]
MEEKGVDSIPHEAQEDRKVIGVREESHEQLKVKPDSPTKEGNGKLESAKAEKVEVIEENARLKMMLDRIEKDYHSLQLQFFDILKQDHQLPQKSAPHDDDDDGKEPDQLVSLCLGRRSSPSSDESRKDDKQSTNSRKARDQDDQDWKSSLTLGLDSKLSTETVTNDHNPSSENSVEELNNKEEEAAGETWPPRKIQRTMSNNGDDDVNVAKQSHVKRARVCVRARCDTPTMQDGCQWRKYGQKIAKGNPCPRAYFRCTVAPACPVRKQVQRCLEDMSILITTYEGTHNHPLSVTATAMASTTSAAASMLLSGSSTSQSGLTSTTTTSDHQLHGSSNLYGSSSNFSIYDNSRPKHLYFPNTTTSSSALFPTITLDLTTPSPSSSSSTHVNNKFSSIFHSSSRFPTSSVSFSSGDQSNSSLSTIWGNNGYHSFNSNLPYNNQTHVGSLSLGKQSQEHVYPTFMDKTQQAGTTSQQALAETLTKAITSGPSFRSVVATAISSLVGANQGNQGQREAIVQNLLQTLASNTLSSQDEKGCASSYFNGFSTTSSNSQTRSSLIEAALPLSIVNSSTSIPPSNNKEQNS